MHRLFHSSLLVLIVTAVSLGQETQETAAPKRMLDRFDKDGDGKVERAEATGQLKPAFNRIDTNSGGVEAFFARTQQKKDASTKSTTKPPERIFSGPRSARRSSRSGFFMSKLTRTKSWRLPRPRRRARPRRATPQRPPTEPRTTNARRSSASSIS